VISGRNNSKFITQNSKHFFTFAPTLDQPLAKYANVALITTIIKKIIMADLMKFVQDELVTKKDFPVFGAGDTITVFYEIKEGEKTRTQFFKGVVIQRKGSGNTETFTIRKMSGAVGVERIFPVNMPALQKVEVNQRGKVRRARIYYFRELTGKKAKIKERRR
jgi:large subunit ribosomal protein L19